MREGGGWEDGGTKGRREKQGDLDPLGGRVHRMNWGAWERREGKEKNKR